MYFDDNKNVRDETENNNNEQDINQQVDKIEVDSKPEKVEKGKLNNEPKKRIKSDTVLTKKHNEWCISLDSIKTSDETESKKSLKSNTVLTKKHNEWCISLDSNKTGDETESKKNYNTTMLLNYSGKIQDINNTDKSNTEFYKKDIQNIDIFHDYKNVCFENSVIQNEKMISFAEQNNHDQAKKNNTKSNEKNKEDNKDIIFDNKNKNELTTKESFVNNKTDAQNKLNIEDLRLSNCFIQKIDKENSILQMENNNYNYNDHINLLKTDYNTNNIAYKEDLSPKLLENINSKYSQKTEELFYNNRYDNNNFNNDQLLNNSGTYDDIQTENENSLYPYEKNIFYHIQKDDITNCNTDRLLIDDYNHKRHTNPQENDIYSNFFYHNIEKNDGFIDKKNFDYIEKQTDILTDGFNQCKYKSNDIYVNYHNDIVYNQRKNLKWSNKSINEKEHLQATNFIDDIRTQHLFEKTSTNEDETFNMHPNIIKPDETALLNKKTRKTKKQPYEYDVTRMYVKGRKITKRTKRKNNDKSNEMGFLNMYTNDFELLAENHNSHSISLDKNDFMSEHVNEDQYSRSADAYNIDNHNLSQTKQKQYMCNSFDNVINQNSQHNILYNDKDRMHKNSNTNAFIDDINAYNKHMYETNVHESHLHNSKISNNNFYNFGTFNDNYSTNHCSKNEFIYSCDPCMKKFKRLSTLKIHIFSHIKDADIFKCPKVNCESGFKSQSIAIKHIQHFHEYDKNILIEHLKISKFSSIFRSYTTLLDYYKKYHPNLANPFKGSFCFGCFTYPRSIKDHPCSKVFYSLTQCPTCRKEIICGELENHVESEFCMRTMPNVKNFE